jgi:acyl-CoA dehydrogenase
MRAEPMLRAQVVALDMELAAFDTMVARYTDEAMAGVSLGAKASMLKYLATELSVKRHELMLSVLGTGGLDLEGENARTPVDWLGSLPNRVGGGTSEIQLNVIAKRVLELPGG